MPRTRSINQNIQHRLLPDFRNLGTVLRIVLLANAFAMACAIAQISTVGELWQRMLLDSALLQPVLLSVLLTLYALNEVLPRFTYWRSVAAIMVLVACITLFFSQIGGELFAEVNGVTFFLDIRRMLLAALLTFVLLTYFRWRALAMSPALQDARLQALQARIRPHFLFNSINAVLAIVRAEPKRAEAALEDMADLFRMAMSDVHDLVALKDEVALAQRYLALEQLRMGERLQVRWHTEHMPPQALIPPLVLQPLLENAVYHGIEPLTAGGTIDIDIHEKSGQLHLSVGNPLSGNDVQSDGNRLALSNIRERLSLLFDVEAEYRVERNDDSYHVHIVIPLREMP
ncbi:MAG: histidine kinase [Gammaproteobacteria bacterium]|nr:histidine kinase [Gammaproteobacteria bacterium]MBU1624844.1 histidine kinase [Gammaproteobacteria bacterium]MBU1982688.1 histidine kinase [Gammaproteobacteria bacterium]